MKASTSSPSSVKSLYLSTSCVVFILTTVIGNFGVSDADVALQKDKYPTQTQRSHSTVQGSLAVRIHDASSRSTTLFSPPNTFSERTTTITATSSTPVDLPEYQINLLQNLRFLHSSVSSKDRTSKSTSTTKNKYPPTSPSSSSSFSIQEHDQLYIRLFSSQRQSSTPNGLHTRVVRKVTADELPGLEDSGSKKIDIGYPLPLSIDDYWALDRDRILDQLVIRALANPEEWAKLRETFDKVDGDLKTLLALERRRNRTIFDSSSSINGSLGYSTSVSGNTSTDTSRTIPSSSSTQDQKKNVGAEHHHHVKFAYHRVSDLNAAGQPTNRRIAAVVSLDNSANSESGNKNAKNKSSSLKAFSSESKPFSGLGANKIAEVTALTSSSKRFPSTSHSYGPTSSAAGSESSNSGNYNSNDNFRNSFSRLGNKENYVEFQSDKNIGGANDESDDNRKSESISNNNKNKLPETKSVTAISPVNQSRHNIQTQTRNEKKELVIGGEAFTPQNQNINYDDNGGDGDNHNHKELHGKRHHLARHHHRHLDSADDNFYKYHQLGKTELFFPYQNREQRRVNHYNFHYEPSVAESIGQHKCNKIRQNHHQQRHHSTSDKHHIIYY